MFNWIAQTLAVTALNLRTIPQRLGSSAVAVIGIAGVVVVLVSVLSIAAGFTAAMRDSGSPTRALVMRSGADSEMTSGLGGPEVDIIKQAPGLRRGRAGRARVGGALRHHRPAEEVDQHPGQRADARRRTGRPGGARGSLDHRGPHAAVRHQRGHRRPRRHRAVRRPRPRPDHHLRAEHLAGGRHLRSGRRRRRNGDLVRRPGAAGRVSARQHVPDGAGAPRLHRHLRHVPRLAHQRTRS